MHATKKKEKSNLGIFPKKTIGDVVLMIFEVVNVRKTVVHIACTFHELVAPRHKKDRSQRAAKKLNKKDRKKKIPVADIK